MEALGKSKMTEDKRSSSFIIPLTGKILALVTSSRRDFISNDCGYLCREISAGKLPAYPFF